MNTLFLIIFMISMLGGIGFLVLFIVGLFAKNLKIRPKRSIMIVGICIVVLLVSTFGYSATMSDEQKDEQQKRIEEEERENAEKEAALAEKDKKEAQQAEESKEAQEEKKKTDSATQKTDASKEVTTKKEEQTSSETEIEYDALQTMYLGLTNSTTIEDLDTAIAQNGLCFTKQEYNGASNEGKSLVYKIAYSDNVAVQKYADDGDCLEVSFSIKDNYAFKYAVYEKDFKEVLLYNYGTWYDFREKEPNNQYSGYYYIDLSSYDKKGIVIKYSNGNSVKTNYYKYESAKAVVDKLLGN